MADNRAKTFFQDLLELLVQALEHFCLSKSCADAWAGEFRVLVAPASLQIKLKIWKLTVTGTWLTEELVVHYNVL